MPLLTRRDIVLVAVTATLCLGLPGFIAAATSQEPKPAKPPMGSLAFDWEKLVVKTSANGASRKVCQAPTATLDELECHITTLNKGIAAHPPHRHADEELIIVKEGVVEALVASEWVKLGPGSVIFQAANIDHAIRNAGEQPATYHVIKWNSPGMLRPMADAAAAAKAAVQK
jgi:mannose-6-phosphate isomerase-like protein (cupin superfamily)